MNQYRFVRQCEIAGIMNTAIEKGKNNYYLGQETREMIYAANDWKFVHNNVCKIGCFMIWFTS